VTLRELAADRRAEGHAYREAETVKRHVAAKQMRRCELGADRAKHDELRTLTDRDHDRDPGQPDSREVSGRL
jgi:hypothetical protein